MYYANLVDLNTVDKQMYTNDNHQTTVYHEIAILLQPYTWEQTYHWMLYIEMFYSSVRNSIRGNKIWPEF